MDSSLERARRRPTRRLVSLITLGLVLSLQVAVFGAEEKKYQGKVAYQKTILDKEYRVETIEDEPGKFWVSWGEEKEKWEPKPWHDKELIEKGPVLYTEWLQPMYYPYTIPLEEREKFTAFDCQDTGGFYSPFAAPDYEDVFDAHLYAPNAEYRRDKTGLEWVKWYRTSRQMAEGDPYKKYIFLFRSPRDLLKVGFLQIQYFGDKEDDNYLYLPTVRKVRRLATANRQDVIGGLVLRNEQVGLSKPIHNYKMIGSQLFKPPEDMFTLGAEGEPKDPDVNVKRLDGTGEPCWIYETTPFREDWWFAKQVNWMGIFSLILWRSDSYDREGRLIQRLMWPQMLDDRGDVPNPVGRKRHLVWAVTPVKDYVTGFWMYAYGPERLLSPPIPDDFFNVQTLIIEPKTMDFYRR